MNRSILVLITVAAAGAVGASTAFAAAVQPELAWGNPSCTDLGYDFGYRVWPANAGTYDVPGVGNVTIARNGKYFDWTSTFGIDAVIVAGGPNANEYVYDPPAESWGDKSLSAPLDAWYGYPYDLKQVDFCYDINLKVTKTAETTYKREWWWTIDKVADKDSLKLATGQSYEVNYDVTVGAKSMDSNWAVSGTIKIENPAPVAAKITSVTDVISGGINATVVCGVTFPYTLGAGQTLYCTYSADLPDGTARTNTATVETYGQVDGGSGEAAVTFSAPTTQKDKCVTVDDDQYGPLGTVCASEAPKTFEYSQWVGPYEWCGWQQYENEACLMTSDTSTETCDTHVVSIDVPCGTGCTLTQGYWKTHSHRGPAPEDTNWFLLGDVDGDGASEGADEMFLGSKKTWYKILWTSPSGDPYYILAHQYIAAKLNILNGASSTSAVDAALAKAESHFKWPSLTKAQMTDLAKILDQYNNGIIGPGHCSE